MITSGTLRRRPARALGAVRLPRGGLDRLREAGPVLVQAAGAAGLAWFLAHDVVGHQTPIFAPIVVLLILSHAPGRRTSRAFATTIGAVIGLAIGDVLVAALGPGAIQVTVVTLLALGAATALGASPMVVTHAGIAAVLIATVQPPDGIYSSAGVQRLVDVLIDGGASFAMSAVLPANPLKRTRAASKALRSEISVTLEDVADALDSHDAEAAEHALERARALDAYVVRFREAIEVSEETARIAPYYRRARGPLARQRAAAASLELAVRNVRVLARSSVRVIILEPPTPAELSLAVRDLVPAASGVALELEGAEDVAPATRAAVRAARRATAVAEDMASMPVGAIVAQVRSIAADLLQANGLDRSNALDQVRRHRHDVL